VGGRGVGWRERADPHGRTPWSAQVGFFTVGADSKNPSADKNASAG
jgi:hypothetical protein